MRVLVACEESQEVCKAFRALGHEAYSCDLQECSGGHPEWHIIADVLEVAYGRGSWDLMICHPPCTYFSCAGMHYLKTRPERKMQLNEAFDLVLKLWRAPIHRICLENPQGWLNTNWKKPTQKIQPYYFGDPEMKGTCLWLKNLPRLNGLHSASLHPTRNKPIPERTRIGSDGWTRGIYFCDRMKEEANWDYKAAAKLKSKTFPGIARAMAEQWGRLQPIQKVA